MTRMLPELRGLSYTERLEALGITALETRRLRGDLIEVFKIVKGFKILTERFFQEALGNRRGYSEKLQKSVLIGLMFVDFHLAKELSITGMH